MSLPLRQKLPEHLLIDIFSFLPTVDTRGVSKWFRDRSVLMKYYKQAFTGHMGAHAFPQYLHTIYYQWMYRAFLNQPMYYAGNGRYSPVRSHVADFLSMRANIHALAVEASGVVYDLHRNDLAVIDGLRAQVMALTSVNAEMHRMLLGQRDPPNWDQVTDGEFQELDDLLD